MVIFQEFNKVFTTDFNIDSITSVRQNWNVDTRYNRLEVPRSRHGLLLLTDYQANFELPDGRTLQANPGDVIFLSKGARYLLTFSVPEGTLTHPLLINFRLFSAEGEDVQFENGVVRLCRDNGSLMTLFSAAAQLYKGASTALLKAKVYELLGNLFPISDSDECCIAYISRHYTDRFSVPQLAKRCAMSETAFRKRFKQLTGCSPVQYINKLKIEKACQMLLSGDISPNDICEFLNFYSLPYFYKVFKDTTGITPHQYRDQHIADV